MGDPITVYPIGVVSGGGGQIFGDHRGTVVSRLVPGPAGVDPDAALGLGGFSRIEVVFHFRKRARARRGAARPRGNPAWPRAGVLAGHSPVRPSHLGVSRCARLDVTGLELAVRGLDAVDGAPILGIRPCTAGFRPHGPIREPAWMRELMADYYWRRPALLSRSCPRRGLLTDNSSRRRPGGHPAKVTGPAAVNPAGAPDRPDPARPG